MPPVMHRDEAILMPWVNICEAYCQYLHNTTTRNRDCWLGKLRRETAPCWWRRRVESVWWSHSWEPRIKWRGGFLPRDVTTFAFIQRRLFLYLHSHLLLGGRAKSLTAWYVWITSILNVLEDKKSHNFQALTFLTPMLQVCVVSSFSMAATCDCEARHVDGLFREWWPSDDCFSDSRSRGTGQESRQATQCANKQS